MSRLKESGSSPTNVLAQPNPGRRGLEDRLRSLESQHCSSCGPSLRTAHRKLAPCRNWPYTCKNFPPSASLMHSLTCFMGG